MDKLTEILVDALKLALAEPGEQRLFKSGKLPGLFAGKTGLNAEAAARALRDGLLEVVRTEAKGKTTAEWVRITPRAMEFLHQQESPVQALKDLRTILQTNQEAIPLWLSEMQHQLQSLGHHLAEEAQRWTHRLDALGEQVEAALRRAEAAGPQLPNGMAAETPWAVDALAYLDHRRTGGAAKDCPLPELFAALRDRHTDLSLNAFHEGLRRLHDRHALQLLPFTGSPSEMTEPEYALLDGPNLFYFVSR
ncbi:MAG TPA: hypothetical protein VKU02_15855 [Gemmataceae bacterium]|nr:hypothetical protein [Gemmataceae bacterium]